MLFTLAFFLSGIASWYPAIGAHGCAMTALPRGTVVVIENTSNHRRSWCRVNDYGPQVHGRIIDVSTQIARDLGFYEAGLTHIKLWTTSHVK